MANTNLKVEKVINHSEWLRNCPIFVVRSQLILNTENNKLFVVNELANIGVKTVSKVIIKVECYDEQNQMITSVDNCAYQGLQVGQQGVFGGNKLFAVADNTVSVSIIIKSVTFADETVWNNDYLLKGIVIENPVRIDPNDEVYDVIEARSKESGVSVKFWPYELPGGWRCTCAQLNDEENMTCNMCGASKFWVLDNLNREDILEYKERVKREIQAAIEREAEERRLAAEREAEERRLAAEREAEERRLAAEREAEEKRRAEEEARLAEERAKEEERRIEAEKKAAEERARMEILMAKKDAVRQYNVEQTKKSVKKKARLVGIAVVALIVLFGVWQGYRLISANARYEKVKEKALAYRSQMYFDKALAEYREFANKEEVAELIKETTYEYAEYQRTIGEFEKSIALFGELKGYRDSREQIGKTYVVWAENNIENKDYAAALEHFALAPGLVEKSTMEATKLAYAKLEKESGSFENALNLIADIEKTAEVKEEITDIYYLWGKEDLQQALFDEAIEHFYSCKSYKDAAELIKEAYYKKGEKYAKTDAVQAYNFYLNADGYLDSAQKMLELIPAVAGNAVKQKNYVEAYLLFSKLEDKSAVKEDYEKASYEYAEFKMSRSITKELLDIYKALPAEYDKAKERIKKIESVVDYAGTYSVVEENGKPKNLVVTLYLENDQIVYRVAGEILDSKTLKSESYTLTKGTIKTKTNTYKK